MLTGIDQVWMYKCSTGVYKLDRLICKRRHCSAVLPFTSPFADFMNALLAASSHILKSGGGNAPSFPKSVGGEWHLPPCPLLQCHRYTKGIVDRRLQSTLGNITLDIYVSFSGECGKEMSALCEEFHTFTSNYNKGDITYLFLCRVLKLLCKDIDAHIADWKKRSKIRNLILRNWKWLPKTIG